LLTLGRVHVPSASLIENASSGDSIGLLVSFGLVQIGACSYDDECEQMDNDNTECSAEGFVMTFARDWLTL